MSIEVDRLQKVRIQTEGTFGTAPADWNSSYAVRVRGKAVLTRDQLYSADEAFFTGTAAEVTPIREVDHRNIGKSTPGPLTKEIQEKYFNVVHGRDKRYHHWCDWV